MPSRDADAKVRRDELYACVTARYAPEFGAVTGGGYVNAGTRAFARAYVRRFGALPPEARHSWPWTGISGRGARLNALSRSGKSVVSQVT